MSSRSRAALFALLSILCCGASASAETLRCRSVNGNLNCAGSGGVSCQTVNGQRVCVSGHGAAEQSFGGGAASVGEAELGDAPVLDHWVRHGLKSSPYAEQAPTEGD